MQARLTGDGYRKMVLAGFEGDDAEGGEEGGPELTQEEWERKHSASTALQVRPPRWRELPTRQCTFVYFCVSRLVYSYTTLALA